MLPSSLRFPFRYNKEVWQKGKRARTYLFEFRYIGAENTRWSILVPKKIVKLATRRNRYKRLISEVLVLLSPSLTSSMSVVVKLLRPLPNDTLSGVRQQLEEGITQILSR